MLRSNTLQNILISVRVGAWATTRPNETPLDQAFRTAREVRLLYSVAGSNSVQGYAVMRTPIGMFGKPVIWENGRQFGKPFGVNWRVLFELPFDACNNKQLSAARDGTSLSTEVGDKVVSLLQERAAAAGVTSPQQALSALEGRGGGGGGGGMQQMGGPPPPPPARPRGAAGMGPAGGRPPLGGGPMMEGPGLMGMMGPGNVRAPMGMMGGGMMMPGGFPIDQLAASMQGGFNPAALGAFLQQASAGLNRMGHAGGMPGQQGGLQTLAVALAQQMSSLPPEQQPLALSTIMNTNPMLAEAVVGVMSGGGLMGGPGLNALGGMGMGMAASGLQAGGLMGMGGFGGALGSGMQQALAAQQQMQQQQQQQQQQRAAFMQFDREDVVLEGSDGRVRNARGRSRSRSPVWGGRGGSGQGGSGPDFGSMTYEQYLAQYNRVQQEVQRVAGGGGWQANGSSARGKHEPSPTANGGAHMAGGGASGTGAKAGGQPYTEEE
jgi:hypothetical protein